MSRYDVETAIPRVEPEPDATSSEDLDELLGLASATSTAPNLLHEHRIFRLESRILDLERILDVQPFIAPIATLAPHGIEIIRTIPAVVRFVDGAYLASFMDANMNGSGESELDAVDMLKEVIVDSFQFLTDNEGTLGKEPKRQLDVLRDFIRES